MFVFRCQFRCSFFDFRCQENTNIEHRKPTKHRRKHRNPTEHRKTNIEHRKRTSSIEKQISKQTEHRKTNIQHRKNDNIHIIHIYLQHHRFIEPDNHYFYPQKAKY